MRYNNYQKQPPNYYKLINKMPPICYIEKAFRGKNEVFASLIQAYSDDVDKYAVSAAQAQYVQHVIINVFREGGTKITFEKFVSSGYRSREMKAAFRIV